MSGLQGRPPCCRSPTVPRALLTVHQLRHVTCPRIPCGVMIPERAELRSGRETFMARIKEELVEPLTPADHAQCPTPPSVGALNHTQHHPCQMKEEVLFNKGVLKVADTSSDHTQYLPPYIKEEAVSSDGGILEVPDTSSDHTRCLPPYIKEECDAREERRLADPGICTPHPHHPASQIKEEPSYSREHVSDLSPLPPLYTEAQRPVDGSYSEMNEIEVVYQNPVQATFGDISNLTKYQRAHSKRKTPQCSECGKYFLKKAHLVAHQSSHMAPSPVDCPVCGETFYSASQLSNHRKSHRHKKTFMCHQCGQNWPDKAKLYLDQRRHVREKPCIAKSKILWIPL
ncbi:zinc finger protein 34-like [Dendropsophus ebraccatus]|uniref:zinc finger protein 34-like n=1 Tax=Dendropsophus ebraccatus TaxID=150705 RepID=UPI00383231BE